MHRYRAPTETRCLTSDSQIKVTYPLIVSEFYFQKLCLFSQVQSLRESFKLCKKPIVIFTQTVLVSEMNISHLLRFPPKRQYINIGWTRQGRAQAGRGRNYRRAGPRADICAPLPRERANYLVILILFGLIHFLLGAYWSFSNKCYIWQVRVGL